MYVRSLRGIRGSGEPAPRSGRDVVVRPVLAHARRQQGARIMTEQAVSSRLGRGLAALRGDDEPAPERGPAQRKITVEFLRHNPRNPRKHFNPDEIEALAGSIRQRGIVQRRATARWSSSSTTTAATASAHSATSKP